MKFSKQWCSILILFLFWFSNCRMESNQLTGQTSQYIKLNGYTQGTTYQIAYKSPSMISYREEIEQLLDDFSKSLSLYDSTSIISRVNRNDTTVVPDKYFIEVFNTSLKIAEQTNGFFDFTVAPLVNAWGFVKKIASDSILEKSTIDSLLQLVDYKSVGLKGRRVTKQNPAIQLDANAIAQGYAVDVVVEFLESKRIKNYLVEIGGELRAKGKNDKGKFWHIGIDKPIDNSNMYNRELQVVIKLKNRALATSGSYRRFYVKNGVKYSHTINPKTGYPVKHNLLSATVLAGKCIEADAYATAFMVMGLEKSYQFVKNNPELDAYFIYSDKNGEYQVKYTSGFNNLILK